MCVATDVDIVLLQQRHCSTIQNLQIDEKKIRCECVYWIGF